MALHAWHVDHHLYSAVDFVVFNCKLAVNKKSFNASNCCEFFWLVFFENASKFVRRLVLAYSSYWNHSTVCGCIMSCHCLWPTINFPVEIVNYIVLHAERARDWASAKKKDSNQCYFLRSSWKKWPLWKNRQQIANKSPVTFHRIYRDRNFVAQPFWRCENVCSMRWKYLMQKRYRNNWK